jgi:ubiquinone biosynthesis protein
MIENIFKYFNGYLHLLWTFYKFFRFGLYYIFSYHSKKRKAINLRLFIEDMGPVYIKLGQFISTHKKWLSKYLNNELQKLRDDVRKKNIINMNSLPKNLQIDLIPIASGSIATVHLGIYNNIRVAVKIKRYNVDTEIKATFKTLNAIVKILLLFKTFRRMKLKETIRIVETFINEQTDFILEASNMIWFYDNFNDIVIIPKCYNQDSTKDIIIMDYIPGLKTENLILTKKEKEHMAKSLLGFFLSSANWFGKFHSDLHNGNIAWKQENNNYKLIIYDFGLVGYFTKRQREDINLFYHNMILKDIVGCKKAISNVLIKGINNKNKKLFNTEINPMIKALFASSDINALNWLIELRKVVDKCNLEFYPEMIKFEIALLNIDGLINQLSTDTPHIKLLKQILFNDF